MARIGYARVSTTDQNLDAQLGQLEKEGCEKIYCEKVSGAKKDRPELMAMMEYAREGDEVIVTKLDRIGRNTKHLLETIEELGKRGIAFKALNLGMDTSTPTGKLMLTVVAAIATFEREMLLERQAEGIEIAKSKGVYKGRKPTAREKTDQVLMLLGEGKTKQEVADTLKIGIASVYRIAGDHKSV
jgi:DNA invertase Pin-like site-specific DNA recombinase